MLVPGAQGAVETSWAVVLRAFSLGLRWAFHTYLSQALGWEGIWGTGPGPAGQLCVSSELGTGGTGCEVAEHRGKAYSKLQSQPTDRHPCSGRAGL